MTRTADESIPVRIRDATVRMVGDPDLRVLYVAFAGIWFANDLYAQLVPLLFAELRIPSTVLGVAWSAVAVVEVAFSPLTGVVADEYDRMSVGAITCFVLTALYAAFLLVGTVAAVVGLMLLVGAVRLLFGNTVTAAISETLSDEIAGIGWGLRDGFIYLGSALGLATGGAIVALTGDVQTVFVALAPVTFLVGVFLWVRGTLTLPDVSLADFRSVSVPSVLEPVREISDWGVLRKFLVVKVFVGFGVGGTMFLLPVFAVDVGIGASGFLAIFAASHLVGIVMSVLGGVVANVFSRKYLYVANFAVEGAMLLAFAATSNVLFFGIGMSLFVVQTLFEPAVVSFFFEQFDDEEAGRAWSVDGFVSKGVVIVAPAVGGAVYAVDPHLTFAAGGVLTLLAAAVATTIS